MSIVIGIDVGISSTKIIGIENETRIKTPMQVPGNDPIVTSFGALSKYIYQTGISLDEVEHIMLTGVGAQGLNKPFYDVPTSHVDEFIANGLGARFDCGIDRIIVVSMGTGTSLVRVDGDDIRHIGGIGMGGGTLQGLSRLLLDTSDISQVRKLAEFGSCDNVNLRMKDICTKELDGLLPEASASLFGKVAINGCTDKKDIADGLIWMVLETIGSCAVLSQSNGGFKDFVLIGGLTQLPQCKTICFLMEKLYGVHFIIPKYAPFCTALGAALSHNYDNE